MVRFTSIFGLKPAIMTEPSGSNRADECDIRGMSKGLKPLADQRLPAGAFGLYITGLKSLKRVTPRTAEFGGDIRDALRIVRPIGRLYVLR